MDIESIVIDGDFLEFKEVTTELLDQIVKEAMNDEVIFDIHPGNKSPLAEFFRIVEKDAQPGSPYRKAYAEQASK